MQANGAEGRKDDRLKEKERERKESLTKVSTVIYKERRGFLPNPRVNSGKVAGNTIRTEACYITPPL